MVFDPWIGDIVSIPCLQGRCKRDPGVPGVWRHKTPNPGVEKRDPGVESLAPWSNLVVRVDRVIDWWPASAYIMMPSVISSSSSD